MSSPYALMVGLDWADQKHALCCKDTATGKTNTQMLEHSPERINEWVLDQLARHPGGRIAVCLEQKIGSVVYALMGYAEVDLFPVNPATLAKYREAFHPSGAKDDPSDAALLLDLLEKHPEAMGIWRPDTEETRLLQRLCQDRRKAVDMRTKCSNSLRSKLKEYYPQALQLVGESLETEMCCAFLGKWPRFQDVAAARPESLRKFYYKFNSRSETTIKARLDLIAASRPLTGDGAVIESAICWVRAMVRQIRDLNKTVEEYDRRIGELFKNHPDSGIFNSFPGAGRQLAPRLMTLFGTDRGRFKTALDVATFNGVAPVMERSGSQMWIHWRWHCPKFARQSLVEFAGHSLGGSAWAKAYYNAQIKRGKDHQAAVRALAFKWVRILFRCWQTRTPYDERAYLAALQRHGSWLCEAIEKESEGANEKDPEFKPKTA